MHRVVIDRFEEGIAVCEGESGQAVEISRERLPEEATPGMTLLLDGDTVSIDWEDTQARRRRIGEKMKKLWKR